jgi:hypothetical protein
MKSFLFTLVFFLSFSAQAVSPAASFPIKPPSEKIELNRFTWMSIKEARQLAGRKFSLKEKIVFKLSQAKLKKELTRSKQSQSSKKSTVALVLSIMSLAALYFPIASIPLAIAAIIIGSKQFKKSNYEDRRAKLAVTLAILSLGITVVALLIYAIFISDGAFGIFILR